METILVVSSILLWILTLFNILLTIGLGRRISARLPKIEFLKVGQTAPHFTAWKLDGKEMTLANYAGQAVTFVFISPHCRPCRDEIPNLEALYPKAQKHGVELALVSDAGWEETRAFANELGVQLPLLVAPRERTSFLRDYKALSTPSYCVVNAKGKVQAAKMDLSELGREIEKLSDTGERKVMSM
jgi:peroxiredoxin